MQLQRAFHPFQYLKVKIPEIGFHDLLHFRLDMF